MMYETENDIPKAERTELIALINQRLADIVDLQMQLKQAHWNVKGPHFIGLHELFDKIAEEVESYVDLTAERIVQLGGIPRARCVKRPPIRGLKSTRSRLRMAQRTWKRSQRPFQLLGAKRA